ncbi:Anaphase-promoting complex subunit cut9 [Fulvia fulva]|uniref:Anaphase-promoting complex subunit cut9 n=1 Tax=Passalora fulva TaxID=5499 RepID=A0A9Q8PBF9_PASFU|nr:Anaphase-promoting complex subunit cut9 [Fulvia fulva]KAK4622046.1 Anaphase-promoting complex subunit cut9 [Fulvia fulva]KAK4622846.1 Anaphase-promoting complex subunit cut9 [Fulvia fulva]UJO19350.1 Anaphase-promoting complex subunit cut9 [Fulvia fulva]WPV16489.1 Anaphase-promoting complex subunit cut9 [Fulvia fulva]WPV31043.1 Anaphase-promoting complex subunit cut9 [Fulvia fulva]
MNMEGMHNFLRSWRQDALDRQQYDTAIFVGDKLLALTKSDDDTLALAHTHFAAGNYTRALAYASRSDLIQRKASARYLAGHCYVKQNRHDDALALLGDKNPVHLITTADGARRKLQHISNGLSSKQHGKSRMPNRTDRVDRSEERDREDASNLKYEAGMCYLRGLCFAKQNAFDRAKECYKDAVRIDVQCFEAFSQLVRNALMTPEEEWQFLDSLNFESIPPPAGETAAVPEAADFTKSLYTMRLNKYTRREEFDAAIETLENYKLDDNPDILLAKAEKLFNASRLRSAVELTNEILGADPYNFACIPLHLSLLHKLNEVNALFALSHDLADTHPHEPCTWLAVGTYYLASNRIPEARSFFSKASMMDPHFGPAWIGFAHTFAEEGESDQAIAAYSTAARLFQGSHLPQLFLGMQEIALGNLSIAREYLTAAYNLCKTDPLLINELGLVSYMDDDLEPAIRQFTLALSIVDENEAPASQYTVIRLNLAHAYRRSGQYAEALEEFDEVIRLGMQDAGVFTSKGLTLLDLEQPFDATVALHSALAISPQDPIATELLNKALEQLEKVSVLAGADEDELDARLRNNLVNIHQTRSTGRRQGRRVQQSDGMDLDGAGDDDSP